MCKGARNGVAAGEGHVSTASLNDTDVRVRDAVLRQLEWDPELDAGAIGVAAKGGTVTLTGKVNWLFQKRESAERAAADAPGITHVENRIAVEPPSFDLVPDEIC
jgi:osmotically-inducible protein OsmY